MPDASMSSSDKQVHEIRTAWLEAVMRRDIPALLHLVTDDVVTLHPDGRATVGKAALAADYEAFFTRFILDQQVTPEQTTIVGDLALDVARVVSRVTPIWGGDTKVVRSRTVVLLRLQTDGAWKVSRVVALLE